MTKTVVMNREYLVDRGANGGPAGYDMVVIRSDPSGETINVSAYTNSLTSKSSLLVATWIRKSAGHWVSFHHYTYSKTENSILSSGQLQHFKVVVNDRSFVGRLQRLGTPDSYSFPFYIIDGLSYLQIRPYPTAEI